MAGAQTVNWTGVSSTLWESTGNWDSGGMPTNAQIARFNNSVQANVGLTATSTTSVFAVGQLFVDAGTGSGRSLFNAGSVPGTLQLHGVGGTLLANASAVGLTFNNSAQGLTLNLAGAGAISITGAGGITIGSVVTGTNGLTKTGSGGGTLSLNGANTFTGGVAINGGAVQLGNASALGSSNALTMGGGTLRLNGNGATVTALGGSTGAINNNHASANATLTVNQASNSVYGGTLINGGTATLGLTKQGAGKLTLTGANAYTGATTVSDGVLELGNGGTTGSLSSSSSIVVASGASLAVNRSNAHTLGAALSGAGGFSNTGAGTTTLTLANTYSGPTTVSAGTLALSGSGSIASSASVLVGSGATLDVSGVTGGANFSGGSFSLASGQTLGGSGSVTGKVDVRSGAAIAPGQSPGKLTVDGDVVFHAGSTFRAELNGTTPGAEYDQLAVNGAVDLGGADLLLSLGFVPSESDFFFLVLNDGADSITGTFSGYPEGASVFATYAGTMYSATLTYKADAGSNALTGGNDIAVSGFAAVPEPSSLCLASLALLCGAAGRRRKSRM